MPEQPAHDLRSTEMVPVVIDEPLKHRSSIFRKRLAVHFVVLLKQFGRQGVEVGIGISSYRVPSLPHVPSSGVLAAWP